MKPAIARVNIQPSNLTYAGRCIDYIKNGTSCHYPDFASCGCEPGTQCIYYPEPLKELPRIHELPGIPEQTLVGKRDFFVRPGE